MWVVIGTFLAVRETLGLTNGRTLGALVGVGAAIAVLLGPPIAFVTVWALLPELTLGQIVATFAYGVFDFNLG